jgi:HAE1 family hydrophobic/amphiphilic exporter-1
MLVFAANFMVLPRLGSEFVPNVDEDIVIVIGELPAGTALEATELAAQRWESAILDHTLFPEIEQTYVVAGRGDSEFDLEPRFISLTLALTEPGARTRRSQDLGKLVAAIGEETVPGLQARLSGGNGGGQPVQVRIFGDDLDELTRLAASAQASLASQPELADVTNGMSAAPELTIQPDPARLKDFGLTTYQVGNTVRIAYQGAEVGKWVQPGGKERDVLVRMPTELRRNPSAVADLPLIRRGEQMITIRQVAGAVAEDKPSKIMRVDRQRVATVGAEPRGVPLGTASTATTQVMNAILPPSSETGLNRGPRWAFAGESEDQAESFAQLGLGLAASIILMYFVLTVLYESAIYPLVVLAALPLASVGAFLGLLVFNQTLSVPSFIGLIALFGLVGKNSILLVDRTNTLRRQGLDRTSALVQAGPSRLRPIIMTSAVLVLSMLPVALKLGDGGEIRAPIGAVLVGGMTTSTFLSLLFVPVVYTYFDSLQQLIIRVVSWRPVFGRPRGTGHPEGQPAKLERHPPSEVPIARQLAPIAGGAPTAAERVRLLRDHGRHESRFVASRTTETGRATHHHQLLTRRPPADTSER